ncbi:unnamed protein product [Mycena citricolor]|uniref:Uncharacterized protein n=1 Tax=Mycena citricolor TaxID=2018698 RepID=A0AAD2GUY7_9AGAR|nr:unnamed protein product [Mycena citricolor]
MQVRWTKGRQLSYKDHIINFPQNVENIAATLPQLPEDVDLVIIRREGVNLLHHVDFVIANDPNYADLVAPDEVVLSQLPVHGSIVDQLSVCREGRQEGDVPVLAGPAQAAETEQPEEDTDSGGASVGGILNLGLPVQEEVVEMREGATRAVTRPRYEQTIIAAPSVDSNAISEYTPGYMTRAFPTLFPDGAGDFFAPHQRKIKLGEYFKHLL